MGFLSSFFDTTKSTRKFQRAGLADFDKTRAMTDPFFQSMLESGQSAGSLYDDFLGLNGQGAQQGAYDGYLNSPGFDATFASGTRALDQSGAARGMSQSGDQAKALQGYGQGLYAQDMGNYLDRLQGQQSGGFAGAQGLTGNSMNYNNLMTSFGQSKDAGMQGGLSNVLGLTGTAASFFGGGGGSTFGKLF